MDNLTTATALYRLSERDRELASDHLIKSNAPNAKDLCTGNLNFGAALAEAETRGRKTDIHGSDMSEIINSHTETVKVRKSTREAAVDLSQSFIRNLAMVKLLNHYYKQDRTVLEGFRPNG